MAYRGASPARPRGNSEQDSMDIRRTVEMLVGVHNEDYFDNNPPGGGDAMGCRLDKKGYFDDGSKNLTNHIIRTVVGEALLSDVC